MLNLTHSQLPNSPLFVLLKHGEGSVRVDFLSHRIPFRNNWIFDLKARSKNGIYGKILSDIISFIISLYLLVSENSVRITKSIRVDKETFERKKELFSFLYDKVDINSLVFLSLKLCWLWVWLSFWKKCMSRTVQFICSTTFNNTNTMYARELSLHVVSMSLYGCAIKFLRVIRAKNATNSLLYIDEYSPFLLKVSRLLRGQENGFCGSSFVMPSTRIKRKYLINWNSTTSTVCSICAVCLWPRRKWWMDGSISFLIHCVIYNEYFMLLKHLRQHLMFRVYFRHHSKFNNRHGIFDCIYFSNKIFTNASAITFKLWIWN